MEGAVEDRVKGDKDREEEEEERRSSEKVVANCVYGQATASRALSNSSCNCRVVGEYES